MKVTVSKRQRRLLVRVSGTEDLLSALEDIAHKEELRRAWVRGVGTLERASLEHVEIDEPCEILSLEGGLCWDDVDPVFRLRVTLAPLSGRSLVVGGVLEKGPAIDVDLFLECFDDVPVDAVRAAPKIEPPSRTLTEPAKEKRPRRGSERPTRPRGPSSGPNSVVASARENASRMDVALASSRVEPEPEAAPVSWADVAAASATEDEAPVSWADVAAASAEEEIDAEPAFEPLPQPKRQRPQPKAYEPPAMPKKKQPSLEVVPSKGDFVQHRQFGLCKIEKTDGRGGIVIKLKSGVRKTVRLDFMDVGRPRQEGGRTVYPLRPRKR